MRTPRFWYAPPDWRSALLSPLGALYAAATARRLARGARARVSVPVICIGNINAGGTGKTPTVIALAERLRNMGQEPHVITRGYGGTETGPLEVDPARHGADAVGDEPLLIAAFAHTWVARDRLAGALAAIEAGAKVILLDDSLQNPALHHDLTLVTVDAARGFGNGRCIPAGPLREPVDVALARADFLLTIGNDAAQNAFRGPDTPPRLRGDITPLQTGMDWSGRYIAFAGIAHPQKFFDTLQSLGATLLATHALGDHEPLSAALLARLTREAATQGAQLVTTEKDAARLPAAYRGSVITLPVRLQIADPAPLDAALTQLFATLKPV